MSLRAAEVEAAYRWGVPLHIWDGEDGPTLEQKAEMIAQVRRDNQVSNWEERVRARDLEKKAMGGKGIKIG